MKVKIKIRLIIALVISLACISLSFQSELDILTIKTNKINEPNINMRPFTAINEQPENNSPNQANGRILGENLFQDVIKSITQKNSKFIPVNSKYNVTLSDTDINAYMKIMDLKLAFENDFEYLPRYFSFDKEYLESYQKFAFFFGSIALGFVGAMAVFFLIRFLFNRFRPTKFVKPKSQPVDKQFRNITWGLFIIGSVAFIITYSLILNYSFDINQGVTESFDFAKEKSKKIANEYISALESYKNKTSILNYTSEEMEGTFKTLAQGLQVYKAQTDENIDKFFDIEEKKNMFSVVFFIFYILIILLVLVLIIKKYKEPVIYISNIVLLTIPILIILSCVVSIYFFIYTDFCYSIHSAIYENNFPVYNKGVGKIVSCFNSTTKSALFQVDNEFNLIANEIDKKVENSTVTDYKSLLEIQYLYKNNVTSTMKALMECDHVYEILPQIQSNSCTKGKQWVNMIELYLLLIVFVAMIGFSFKRSALYIQKKIDERKDMEQNLLFQ